MDLIERLKNKDSIKIMKQKKGELLCCSDELPKLISAIEIARDALGQIEHDRTSNAPSTNSNNYHLSREALQKIQEILK